MWLRKTRNVPGAAPGGYTWGSAEDVVEVPDPLGADLLAIPGAGFTEAAAPGTTALSGPPGDSIAVRRRPGRPRTVVTE